MRFCLLLLFWIMGICLGTGQSVSPPQFNPYTGPTMAYPETPVGFSMLARSFQTNSLGSDLKYELLEAPTNVSLGTIWARPDEQFALIQWQTPSRAAVGSTNRFVIRATDYGVPALSATSAVSFVLVDLPPIHSILISNGVPTLQFSNVVAVQTYLVLWSADLSATNWSPLCEVGSSSSLVTVADNNGLRLQRFYKLVPDGGWCYGFCP